jgi:hypothetical protein
MGHEDATGIRSALGKTYGSGGYKLSFTGTCTPRCICYHLQRYICNRIPFSCAPCDRLVGGGQEQHSGCDQAPVGVTAVRCAFPSVYLCNTLGRYTRAVFLSFGLFVPSTNYFFVATFLVECFSTVRRPSYYNSLSAPHELLVSQGGLASSSNVRFVRLFNVTTQDSVYFIAEIIMYALSSVTH